MKNGVFLLALLLLSGCTALELPSPGNTVGSEAETLSGIDCNRMIGRWAGEKVWSADRSSRWLVTHQANGSMQIDFTTTYQGQERQEHYEGDWQCQDGMLKTRTSGSHGKVRNHTYRLLELTERLMHYQSVTHEGLGPKFVSERVR